MPLLIAALLGGMVLFFFQSDPERMAEKAAAERESLATGNEELPDAEDLPSEALEAVSPSTEDPSPGETSSSKPGFSSVASPSAGSLSDRVEDENIPAESGIEHRELDARVGLFTPWLSPLALDSYMRAKDQGHEVGFWERGHWITTIEGRWKDGSHEFRIRYDAAPDHPGWRWRYKINLPPDEFLEEHAEMRKKGFRLVQSQSFLHPDQRRRYQAVWESDRANLSPNMEAAGASRSESASRTESAPRSEETAARVADRSRETTSPASQPSPTVRRYFGSRSDRPTDPGAPLDVNNLEFR